METTEKEAKIIELLNEGKSYSYIQETLQVSPNKITAVKRNYFSINSNNCTTSSATDSASRRESGSGENNTIPNHNSMFNRNIDKEELKNTEIDKKFNSNKPKTSTIMRNIDNSNSNYHYNAKLEKLKAEQSHELELKKLELKQDELELQNREFNLKKAAIDADAKKIERQSKSLIFQFRKLMVKYQKGKWTYQQLCQHRNVLLELQEQIEEFCFKEGIDTENQIILNILNKTIQNFKTYAEEIFEEDVDQCEDCEDDCEDCNNNVNEFLNDVMQITVDSETQIMIDQSQTIDFDDYE